MSRLPIPVRQDAARVRLARDFPGVRVSVGTKANAAKLTVWDAAPKYGGTLRKLLQGLEPFAVSRPGRYHVVEFLDAGAPALGPAEPYAEVAQEGYDA